MFQGGPCVTGFNSPWPLALAGGKAERRASAPGAAAFAARGGRWGGGAGFQGEWGAGCGRARQHLQEIPVAVSEPVGPKSGVGVPENRSVRRGLSSAAAA